ncbi:hypothetical protein [Phormidium tenue]|nr:hypothetical protein [Phormidium tenue]MBD2230265.1 hypothetical protein [Phormidium tenue FACHB-1052]
MGKDWLSRAIASSSFQQSQINPRTTFFCERNVYGFDFSPIGLDRR